MHVDDKVVAVFCLGMVMLVAMGVAGVFITLLRCVVMGMVWVIMAVDMVMVYGCMVVFHLRWFLLGPEIMGSQQGADD